MVRHCCVPDCTSDSRKNPDGLSFHPLPKDDKVRKVWLTKIRRDVGPQFTISSSTCVCSLHFTKDCFPIPQGQVIKRLKVGSIPTVFKWSKTTTRRVLNYDKTDKPATKKRKVLASEIPSTSDTADESQPGASTDSSVSDTIEMSSSDSLAHLSAESSPDKAALRKKNMDLLDLRSHEKFTYLRFVNNDSDIHYYTGFQNYQSLDAFYQFLLPECQYLYYVGKENTSAGKPYELLRKSGPSRSLSPMEELFLTLVRLRRGLEERIISDLYNVSESHISRIFNTWIIFLRDRLQALPIWPSQEFVRSTTLPCFKDNYPNTRAIIDCTELFLEQPSAAGAQRETFSSYKHCNTAKALIAISPSGVITYFSQLYSGRCSDKKIIKHCGFLDLLQDGDSLMADKGFDIENELKPRNITLNIPSFLSLQDQFTEQQLKESRQIAAVRVHVERAVRKIKEFKLLRNRIPISIAPMLDNIWTVCCHLANFSGPLINVSKS